MPENTPAIQVQLSPHFRVIYANLFELRVTDNEVTLGLSCNPDTYGPGVPAMREAAVVITLRSLKVLAHSLSAVVANFEAEHGAIPVTEAKLAEIDKAMTLRRVE